MAANEFSYTSGGLPIFTGKTPNFLIELTTPGYSGGFERRADASGIITNPYGAAANVSTTYSIDDVRIGTTLRPGQSYNYLTGGLSDPDLHPLDAQKKSDQANIRSAKMVGLEQGTQTTARGEASVLRSLDEMYFANQNVKLDTNLGDPVSDIAQARSGGFNTSNVKTILGNKPAAVAAKASSKGLR